jgi:hypothetical protein
MEAVFVLDSERLPVFDALAPAVRLAVGEALTVELEVSVVDGIMLPVPLPLCVDVALCVGDDNAVAIFDELAPGEWVKVGAVERVCVVDVD